MGSVARHTFIFLLYVGTACPAGSSPTNMDMLAVTVQEAVDQALERLEVPAGTVDLLVTSQKEHKANWLVEHLLTLGLLDLGFTTTLDSTSVDSNSAHLAYRVLDLGVSGRTGLFTSTISRRSHVRVALQLSRDADAVLIWRDEVGAARQDHIARSRMDLLQGNQYEFAETNLEARSWSKSVEPVILSGVLGGLIYLFFSNR